MEGLTARIVARPGPRPSISLGFELANSGDAEWTGTVFEPVIPWDLRAWVDGEQVAVRQPELDVGVRPRRLRLAPGERSELRSPIVLVFEGDEGPDSPFVWVLGARPDATVELEATITVSGTKLAAPRVSVDVR